MNQREFEKLSPSDRMNYLESATGLSRKEIATRYPGIASPAGSRGLQSVWTAVQPQIKTSPSAPFKTEAEKAREEAQASEQDLYAKTKALLEGLPQYQNALQGKEWEQAYGEAYGTGPLAAYEALRKGATEREANEQQRLAAALQDELQGVDIGRAGQLVNAYGGLAMGGGLSSGARERIGASSLESAMGQRQAQRLQNQRSLFDLGAKTREQMLGIGADEAKTRMGMQEAIVKAKQAEELRRQQLEMERAQKLAQFEADQLAAKQQEQIAAASAPKGGK